MTLFGDEAFTEATNENEVVGVGPSPVWLVSLWEGHTGDRRSQREDHAKGPHKPSGEARSRLSLTALLRDRPADAWILDLQAQTVTDVPVV